MSYFWEKVMSILMNIPVCGAYAFTHVRVHQGIVNEGFFPEQDGEPKIIKSTFAKFKNDFFAARVHWKTIESKAALIAGSTWSDNYITYHIYRINGFSYRFCSYGLFKASRFIKKYKQSL